MPGFSYRVIDADGRERKGNMSAPSLALVEKKLTSEGLIVVDIEEIELLGSDSLFGRGRITSSDLFDFCNQFAHLYKSGIGTVNTLRMMAEQSKSKKMSNVIDFLVDQSVEGEMLFEAMNNADVFPKTLIAVVEAGETSGHLLDNIERMAVYYDKTRQREESIKKSLLYPAYFMTVICLVILGILMFVVPGFMRMIDGVEIVIPLSTRLTVGVSKVLVAKWWLLLIILIVLFAGYEMAKRTRTGRVFVSRFRINYKGLYERRCNEDCASFARLMSTLLLSGIPLTKALELTGNSYQEHVIFRRSILRAKEYVAAGGSLSRYLETTNMLPKMFANMVAIGEETGQLNEMFDNAADYYEKEFDESVRKLTTLLEPVIVAVLSIVLGFIILSLLKPLLVLYEAVGSM